jgi:hypothetical protein
MTRAEQETIFRYAADEDIVSVFTAHPPTARKLERFGYQPVRVSTQGGEPVGWFYKVPLAEFRWRAGKRSKRAMSPEARQAGADRLAKARLARVSL